MSIADSGYLFYGTGEDVQPGDIVRFICTSEYMTQCNVDELTSVKEIYLDGWIKLADDFEGCRHVGIGNMVGQSHLVFVARSVEQ